MEEILKTWHGKIIAVNSPPPASVKLPISTYLGPDDVEIGKMLAVEALKTASARKYILRHKDNYYPFTLREEGIRKLIPEAISISVNNIPEIKESDIVISFGNRATEALIEKNITAKIIAIDGTKKIKKATNVASFDQGISSYLSPLNLGSEKITS